MNSKKIMPTNLLNNIMKNWKIEFLISVVGVIWVLFLDQHFYVIICLLDKYFSGNRCSAIASFMGVLIGIYVAVWSIFATSTSKINEEILKNRIEGQLFFNVIFGVLESFVDIVLCIFLPVKFPAYSSLLLFTTVIASVSFVKFAITIFVITKLNIQYIILEIDAQNKEKVEFSVKLDEIYHRLVK